MRSHSSIYAVLIGLIVFVLLGCKKKNVNISSMGSCPGSECATWVDPVVAPCENLVLNGSFETLTGKCPGFYSQTSRCEGLSVPNKSTADYFNCCGSGKAGVPNNHFGVQNPYDGRGYAGGGVVDNGGDYMEYIQLTLKQPLQVGAEYEISFQVSLADNSRNAFGPIGVAAVPHLLNESGYNLAGTVVPDMEFNTVVTDKHCWEELKGRFTATNAANYLVIGIFRKIEDMTRIKTGGSLKNLQFKTYMYYDAVKLRCL